MLGPVFYQEMMLGGRRNQLHVFRWIYAGWLVLQIGILFFYYSITEAVRHSMAGVAFTPSSAPEVIGSWFTNLFLYQQMILLLLATPALVAGAVADEKRRGTLQFLLLAGLDTRHILLGKLFGRVAQVALLMIAGLPLFALLAGFSGVGPFTMLVVAVALVMPLFALSAATLLASVFCRQTRDAVLALYLIGIVAWVVVWVVGGPLSYFNPIYVLQPAWGPLRQLNLPLLAERLIGSLVAWGTLGAACLAVAVWQLRPVYIRELETRDTAGTLASTLRVDWRTLGVVLAFVAVNVGLLHALYPLNSATFVSVTVVLLVLGIGGLLASSAVGRALARSHPELFVRQPVGDDPVHWRERNVEGLAPFPALRRFPPLYALLSLLLATAAACVAILAWSVYRTGNTPKDFLTAVMQFNIAGVMSMFEEAYKGFYALGMVVQLAASMIVGIRCSGSITAEREKQTWEALLLTPLSAKQMVYSKLWGVMGASYWYLLAYAAPAVIFSVLGGLLSLVLTVLLVMQTALAMYFIGAAGIYCSASSKTSWRSLLRTMAWGYLGGLLISAIASPLILILWGILSLIFYLVDVFTKSNVGKTSSGYIPALLIAIVIEFEVMFWIAAKFFLGWAQRWIADRERTRHWYDEPVYRRSRRPLVREPYARQEPYAR
jgi:ABC-type transport system involved in multi-copper enzyme maturation permease subunit